MSGIDGGDAGLEVVVVVVVAIGVGFSVVLVVVEVVAATGLRARLGLRTRPGALLAEF